MEARQIFSLDYYNQKMIFIILLNQVIEVYFLVENFINIRYLS